MCTTVHVVHLQCVSEQYVSGRSAFAVCVAVSVVRLQCGSERSVLPCVCVCQCAPDQALVVQNSSQMMAVRVVVSTVPSSGSGW